MRVFIFIDASNIWAAQKSKGKMFDYVKLQKYLQNEFIGGKLKFYYYAAYPAIASRAYDTSGKHKFLTYLKKGLKFNVIKKVLKTILTEEGNEEKGNMDVEMTIDIVHNISNFDIAVIFTGDSDFLPVLNYIKGFKKTVYIYSSKNNISEELRTGGSGYKDILKIDEDIWGKDIKNRDSKT